MESFLLDPVANDQLFLYSLSNPSPCKACGRNVHGQGVALIVICLVGVQLQFLSFPIFSFFFYFSSIVILGILECFYISLPSSPSFSMKRPLIFTIINAVVTKRCCVDKTRAQNVMRNEARNCFIHSKVLFFF